MATEIEIAEKVFYPDWGPQPTTSKYSLITTCILPLIFPLYRWDVSYQATKKRGKCELT